MIPRNKVRSVQDVVSLQWANGRVNGKRADERRFGPLVGFHIEVGKDESLDRALYELSVPVLEIKHPRPGGAAEVVRHWDLGESCALYVVSAGPVAPTVAQSRANGNAHATAEAGIGLRWAEGERSRLAVRGFLALLGAEFLVQLAAKSRMTDELLKALVAHAGACEAADGLIDRQRHPEIVAFHEVALELGPADEVEWGKGETATVTPFRHYHPATIDKAYLRQPGVWRPDAVHDAACASWEAIQLWAHAYASEEPGQREDAL